MSKSKVQDKPVEELEAPFDPIELRGVGEAIAHRILRSWASYELDHGERNDMPSKTVPNQSMSIREIFQRFASGQPLSQNTDLVYTGDDPSPDLKRFDIEEIHEMQRQNVANMRRLSDEMKARSAANKAKAVEKQLAEEAAAKRADVDAAVKAAKDNPIK